jgi:hypothetical protein
MGLTGRVLSDGDCRSVGTTSERQTAFLKNLDCDLLGLVAREERANLRFRKRPDLQMTQRTRYSTDFTDQELKEIVAATEEVKIHPSRGDDGLSRGIARFFLLLLPLILLSILGCASIQPRGRGFASLLKNRAMSRVKLIINPHTQGLSHHHRLRPCCQRMDL